MIDGGMRATLIKGSFKSNTAWAGIVVHGGSHVVMSGSVFEENHMCQGLLHCSDSRRSSISVKNTAFSHNSGWEKGAAVFVGACGTTAITSSNFTGNEVGQQGGAVYVDGRATVTMTATNLTSNHARKGGAISVHDADLTMQDCVLDSNAAHVVPLLAPLGDQYGHYELGVAGAVYCVNSNVVMVNTNLTRNTAVMDGGECLRV